MYITTAIHLGTGSRKCFIAFCLNVLIYAVTARVTGQANNYVNPVPDSNESHHMYGKLHYSSYAHYPNIIETITPSINVVSFSIPRIDSSNLNSAAVQGLNAEISQRYTHPVQSYNLRLLAGPFPGYQDNNGHHHSIPVHESISSPIKQTHERTNNLQKFLPKPKSLQNLQQLFRVLSVDNAEPLTLVRQGMKTLTTKALPSLRPAVKSESYNHQFPNLVAVASSASPHPQVYAAPRFNGNNHESNTAQEASNVPKEAISSNYKIEHLRSSPGSHLLNSGSADQIHDRKQIDEYHQIYKFCTALFLSIVAFGAADVSHLTKGYLPPHQGAATHTYATYSVPSDGIKSTSYSSKSYSTPSSHSTHSSSYKSPSSSSYSSSHSDSSEHKGSSSHGSGSYHGNTGSYSSPVKTSHSNYKSPSSSSYSSSYNNYSGQKGSTSHGSYNSGKYHGSSSGYSGSGFSSSSHSDGHSGHNGASSRNTYGSGSYHSSTTHSTPAKTSSSSSSSSSYKSPSSYSYSSDYNKNQKGSTSSSLSSSKDDGSYKPSFSSSYSSKYDSHNTHKPSVNTYSSYKPSSSSSYSSGYSSSSGHKTQSHHSAPVITSHTVSNEHKKTTSGSYTSYKPSHSSSYSSNYNNQHTHSPAVASYSSDKPSSSSSSSYSSKYDSHRTQAPVVTSYSTYKPLSSSSYYSENHNINGHETDAHTSAPIVISHTVTNDHQTPVVNTYSSYTPSLGADFSSTYESHKTEISHEAPVEITQTTSDHQQAPVVTGYAVHDTYSEPNLETYPIQTSAYSVPNRHDASAVTDYTVHQTSATHNAPVAYTASSSLDYSSGLNSYTLHDAAGTHPVPSYSHYKHSGDNSNHHHGTSSSGTVYGSNGGYVYNKK
uniref:Uncharacterized protein n=1 Tax=Glossina austeni TaxID=7395 RepID=A0A1A9V737_GLOAU